MTLSADIVDQQVQGLAERYREQLEAAVGQPLDDDRARSVAFVALCVKTMLKLSVEESFVSAAPGPHGAEARSLRQRLDAQAIPG